MALQPPSDRYALVQYLQLEQKHVDEINRILKRASVDISRQIAKAGGLNPLTQAQLKAQQAAIKAMARQNWTDVGKAIQKGQVDAAAEASKVISQYENVLFQATMTKEGMAAIANAEAQRAASTINSVMARQLSSYKPLAQSVYKTQALTNGWVDNIVNSALARGLNAAQLAAEVKKFIDPNVAGGASYAANRLARTEINNAYHASSIQRYQDSALIDEVDWHLSSSHPDDDDCDALATNSPYDVYNVPEKPHPNCYCYTTPTLISREKFIKNLLAGQYDSEDWIDGVDSRVLKDTVLSGDPLIRAAQSAPKWNLPDVSGMTFGERNAITNSLAKDVYEGQTFGEGYTTTVKSTITNTEGKSIVYLDIVDKDGALAGTVERTFSASGKTVDHDLMSLQVEHRGKGFSSDFSKFSEAYYKSSGIEEIKVHAALSDGGYAWARAGYDWDTERYVGGISPQSVIDSINEQIVHSMVIQNMDQVKALTAMQQRFIGRRSEWPKPAELAAMTGEGKKYNEIVPLGKAIMRGTDWYGQKAMK